MMNRDTKFDGNCKGSVGWITQNPAPQHDFTRLRHIGVVSKLKLNEGDVEAIVNRDNLHCHMIRDNVWYSETVRSRSAL